MLRHALIPLCNKNTSSTIKAESAAYDPVYCSACCFVAFQPFNYANVKVLVHNAENISIFKPTWVKSSTPGSENRMSFLWRNEQNAQEHTGCLVWSSLKASCTPSACIHFTVGFYNEFLSFFAHSKGTDRHWNASKIALAGANPALAFCSLFVSDQREMWRVYRSQCKLYICIPLSPRHTRHRESAIY